MEIKAKLNYLRIAPRKVRLVADLIRGMDIKQAETQLKFLPKRASVPLLKLLKSAIANAKNTFNLEKDDLYIEKILINQGPSFKRWRPVSRGRAFTIMKRTSHVSLVLGVKKGIKGEKPIKKVEPAEAKKKVEETKVEKPKFKAPKEISKRPESRGLFKKIFRRKSF